MATAQRPMTTAVRPVPPRRARSTRLLLTGRVDALEVPEIQQAAADLSAAGVIHIEVDLSEVDFLDSAGLAALVRLRRECLAAGGSLTLVRPRSDDALRVFRLTQLDRVFAMVDPPDAAAERAR